MALEAIRGDLTLVELAAKHGIHHTMIASWKKQAIEGMAGTISGAPDMARASGEAELEKLHAKIGQLVFCSQGLGSLRLIALGPILFACMTGVFGRDIVCGGRKKIERDKVEIYDFSGAVCGVSVVVSSVRRTYNIY